MKQYKLSMLSELSPLSDERTIEAETDEEAIRKAEEESDKVPVLICMDLYRTSGTLVKHWGKYPENPKFKIDKLTIQN